MIYKGKNTIVENYEMSIMVFLKIHLWSDNRCVLLGNATLFLSCSFLCMELKFSRFKEGKIHFRKEVFGTEFSSFHFGVFI